ARSVGTARSLALTVLLTGPGFPESGSTRGDTPRLLRGSAGPDFITITQPQRGSFIGVLLHAVPVNHRVDFDIPILVPAIRLQDVEGASLGIEAATGREGPGLPALPPRRYRVVRLLHLLGHCGQVSRAEHVPPGLRPLGINALVPFVPLRF